MESYSRDEQVILIIDEAQRLDPTLLEEVRLLTNLETPKANCCRWSWWASRS